MVESHGSGQFSREDFARVGANVVFEVGALVFHPENIEIGDGVYIGHHAILKGYHLNRMIIGDGAWIGQQTFLHSAGGLVIGRHVGIGPAVKIVTSSHGLGDIGKPILHGALEFASVEVGEGSDIGTGTIILPGVRIGRFAQVGAGAVVTSDVDDYAIVAGVPAKLIRMRR